MATGVSVHDQAIAKFNEFKKNSNPCKYIIFKIQDGKVIVDGDMSEDPTYENFLNLLPGDDCRYAVYKREYTTVDGRQNVKLVLIAW
jgi:cofilin